MSLVHVKLFVKLKILGEKYTLARSLNVVGREKFIFRPAVVEVVNWFTEKSEEIVVERDSVLLEVSLIDDGSLGFHGDPHVIQEIMHRLLIIGDIKVRT